MARVAVVTGGTRGIGEAISMALKDALPAEITYEEIKLVAAHWRAGRNSN